MDYLFSPWRMKYITGNDDISGCIFCDLVQMEDGIQNLIVARGKTAYVIMNRYPYTSGHVMVVPYAHQPSIENLDAETRAEIMELINQSLMVVRSIYNPQGFNVGANIGEASGAGIASHVHFHIVPRWSGDTNFMSTLAGTRVLPESLEDTYRRLKEGWK